MFTVLIKDQNDNMIEKNTREFIKASEAVKYLSNVFDWYSENKEIRTIEMKQDERLILAKTTMA